MDIGSSMTLIWIVPFVGMLLSIAICPLKWGEWWESHQLHVAAFWSLLFLVPFVVVYGFHETLVQLAESIVVDYIPFIVLLFGLFAVSGGIHIGGTIAGTTKNNIIMLALGTFLSSWIGTTGSAMLLIRPVLRANAWRKNKKHVVIFFIFLVANIGGCLTPLGDPPLFLGYLRGVPFFWTLEHIWPLLLLNSVVLLTVFGLLDAHLMKKEDPEARAKAKISKDSDDYVPFHIDGLHNVLLLGLIIVAVILNGSIPQMDMFKGADGEVFGFYLIEHVHIGIQYFVQIVLILLAAFISLKTTKKEIREANEFNWEPIAEVARLFIGIFITMIPALAILRVNGGSLGIDSPMKFFWATGALSGFLDNSPTYVVFLTTAGALGASGAGTLATAAGVVSNHILLSISAGAVFMGALTYIGNAPNFMVKSMAESAKIKMPSFFGYMAWSFGILIPLFIIDTLVFFL